MNTNLWQFPKPFTVEWQIQSDDIDEYGHVNNVAYISQLEKVAWRHSNHLGLNIDTYRSLDRAMVIQTHAIRYLLPCFEEDVLSCATWITHSDNRLQLTRRFQFICTKRHKTVFEAETVFVCVVLSSGRPARMPDSFKRVYGDAVIGEQQ